MSLSTFKWNFLLPHNIIFTFIPLASALQVTHSALSICISWESDLWPWCCKCRALTPIANCLQMLQEFYNFVSAAGLSFTLLVKNWLGFNQLFRKALLRLEWYVRAEIQNRWIIVISGQKCLGHTVKWFLLWFKFRLGFKRLSVLTGSTSDADALCVAGPNLWSYQLHTFKITRSLFES